MWTISAPTTEERRRAPRALYRGRVLIEEPGGSTICEGINLSAGGVLVRGRFARPLLVGQIVRVLFQVPAVDRVIASSAVVVHARGAAQVGLRFFALDEALRRILSTFVFTGSGRVREYRA
jgi:c-di-GMP-binding flagellar brake protein YcgR